MMGLGISICKFCYCFRQRKRNHTKKGEEKEGFWDRLGLGIYMGKSCYCFRQRWTNHTQKGEEKEELKGVK